MIEELDARAEALLPTAYPELSFDELEEGELFYGAINEHFGPAVASLFRAHEKHRVILEVNDTAFPTADGSYIGGHPFVSAAEDFSWPLNGDSGRPMTFLLQLNFAELPKLESFPESGLIQWWIKGDDDLYGLNFGPEASGREGLLVKFYSQAELADPASSPFDSIPNESNGELHELGPLWSSKPFPLKGRSALSFPSGYEESTVDGGVLDIFGEVTEALEDGEEKFAAILPTLQSQSQIGGHPAFVQGDPRYATDRPQTLILQLESMLEESYGDVLLWGDAGNAQLFGDLESLSKGDLSSLWWDWACY